MTKNQYSHNDDISDVTGVRSTDKLLFVGSDPMSFMKKYVDSVESVESQYDLDSEFVRHRRFDKVFARIDTYDVHSLKDLFTLTTHYGTTVLFIEDDQERERVKEQIETLWYPAHTWDLVSNVGKCLITNATGAPSNG